MTYIMFPRVSAETRVTLLPPRCSSLLADTYAAVESTPPSQRSEAILPPATNGTSTRSTRSTPRQNDSTVDEDWVETRPTQMDFEANHGAPWNKLVLLARAGEVLRPLGPHPALAMVLRKTAAAWVRRWAGSHTPSLSRVSTGWLGYSGKGDADQSIRANKEHSSNGSCAVRSQTLPLPKDHHHEPWGFLEHAAVCLAEARNVLSSIVAAAEPVVDVLSTSSVIAQKSAPRNSAEKDAGALKSKKVPPKGGHKKEVKKPDRAKTGDRSQDLIMPSSTQASSVVSTPLGRVLIMVELEEACVRSMLGRAKGEARSKKAVREAVANDESITPVQR